MTAELRPTRGELLEQKTLLLDALRKCTYFIENVDEDTPNRHELFFEARESWRKAFGACSDD